MSRFSSVRRSIAIFDVFSSLALNSFAFANLTGSDREVKAETIDDVFEKLAMASITVAMLVQNLLLRCIILKCFIQSYLDPINRDETCVTKFKKPANNI